MENPGTGVVKKDNRKAVALNLPNAASNSSADLKEKPCPVKIIRQTKDNTSSANLSIDPDEGIYDYNSSVAVDEDSLVKVDEESFDLNTDKELKEEYSLSNVDGQILSNSNEIITLKDVLRELFSNCIKNFNVIHINAQSISAHYLAMLATFGDLHNIDAILVSESFLKPKIKSELVNLPGFKLIRNDREDIGSGGVAIYLREGFTFNIVAQSSSVDTKSAEYLFIEVVHQESKVLLGVFYSPSSRINYFPTFEMLLIKYRSLYKHVNILGDFNTDLLKKDRRREKLRSIIHQYNLHVLPLGPTHFAPHSGESLLDLIIVSYWDEVVKHGQTHAYFSYHDLIFVSCKLPNWRKRESPSNAVMSTQCSETQPFWQNEIVRKALNQQWNALIKYKGKEWRGEEDVKEYQIGKKPIQLLEKKFKRITGKSNAQTE